MAGTIAVLCLVVFILICWVAQLESDATKRNRKMRVLRNRLQFIEDALLTREQHQKSRSENVTDDWWL